MSCLKNFIKYVSFNIFGMIGLSCYILADTFFIAKGTGANGLAALNLAIPVFSLIQGFGLMIGIGAGSKYSIFKNQGKADMANRVFTNAAVAVLFVSLSLAVLGAFASDFITRLMGADEEVFEMCKIYLKVILMFAPAFMFNTLLQNFVRNDGVPQLSMIAVLCGSIANIILDYILIFPMGLGIFGAVLATATAPVISMMILSSLFFRGKNGFRIVRCRISKELLLGIFSGGFPSLITELSSGIVIIVFNMIILKLRGNTGVAAYGVIANISIVVMSIYTGTAQGSQPLISGYYGAERYGDIRKVLRYAVTTVAAVSCVLYTCIFFGAERITALFNGEHNLQLQSMASMGLKCYFTSCIFAGFNIVMSIYFTASDNPRPAHAISLLRGFIIIVPMAFLLSYLGGMTGVWFALPATELIVSLISVVFYFKFSRIP